MPHLFTVTHGLTGQEFKNLTQAEAEELMDAIAVVIRAENAPEERPTLLSSMGRQWDNE